MIKLDKILLKRIFFFSFLTLAIILTCVSCSVVLQNRQKQNIKNDRFYDLKSALECPEEVIYLSLGNENIKSLPDEFSKLNNLRRFGVIYNDSLNLKDIISKISKMPSIEHFSLSEYSLCKIPDDLVKLTNIKSLSLRYSENLNLSDLFIKLSKLPNLEHLNLSFGDFEYLPKEIGLLTNLKQLSLGVTPIKEFPDEMKNLKLERLEFCQFPEYFRLLPKEEKLKLLDLLPNTEIILVDYRGPVGKTFILGKREVKLTRDNLWEVKN